MTATGQIVQDVFDQMGLLCSECGEATLREGALCERCESLQHPRCGRCGLLFSRSDDDESGKENGELCEECWLREQMNLFFRMARKGKAEWGFAPERSTRCR